VLQWLELEAQYLEKEVMNFRILIILAFIVLLTACDKNEVVDNTTKEAKIIYADGVSGNLIEYDLVNSIPIKQKSKTELEELGAFGNIKKIKVYRNQIYLFSESQNILVLDITDFKLDTLYKFDELASIPKDICFPNSTTAYVMFDSSNVISIVDIHNKKIAFNYTSSGIVSSISALGNKLFLTDEVNNNFKVNDVRDNSEIASILASDYPVAIQPTSDGKFATVLCNGKGKRNPEELKTNALLLYFDLVTYKQTNAINLGINKILASNQDCKGYVLTSSDFGYIITNEVLFRFDSKLKSRLRQIGKVGYDLIAYNLPIDEVYVAKVQSNSTLIDIYDAKSANKKDSYNLNSQISAFIVR